MDKIIEALTHPIRPDFRPHFSRTAGASLFAALALLISSRGSAAETGAPSTPPQPALTTAGKPAAELAKSIEGRLEKVRELPDEQHPRLITEISRDIRLLPSSEQKLMLAAGVAAVSTEGDNGYEVIQSVATTLEEALRQNPVLSKPDVLPFLNDSLAALVHYEGAKASLDTPLFKASLARFEEADKRIETADFTLKDLNGKSWTLQSLHGKVVLVNFWATWCPPCRKELPDLQALSERFKGDLIVLGITDEKPEDVRPFIARNGLTYPILLDPESAVGKHFGFAGIPHTYVYDRNGKLATQAMDMRTRKQLEALLARARLPTAARN